MKIVVTQRHINRGRKYSACCCPVALAFRENANLDAAVCHDDVYITGIGTFVLPSEAQHFVESFDLGKDVEPFEFEIEIASKLTDYIPAVTP